MLPPRFLASVAKLPLPGSSKEALGLQNGMGMMASLRIGVGVQTPSRQKVMPKLILKDSSTLSTVRL